MSSPFKKMKTSPLEFKRKFSDSLIFQKESNPNKFYIIYYYLALFQRIKTRTLLNIQKSLNKKENDKNKINITNNIITSTGFVHIPKIINNLFKLEAKDRIDDLINLISEKYQDEGYFYIPQFCAILKEKN